MQNPPPEDPGTPTRGRRHSTGGGDRQFDEPLSYSPYAVPSVPFRIPASRMYAVLAAAGLAFAGALLWPTQDADQPSPRAQPAVETQHPAAPAPVIAPTAGAPQAVVAPTALPQPGEPTSPGWQVQNALDQCTAQGNTGNVMIPVLSSTPMSCETMLKTRQRILSEHGAKDFRYTTVCAPADRACDALPGGSIVPDLRIFGDAPTSGVRPPAEETVPWREIALGGAAGAAVLGLLAWAWTQRRRAAARRHLLAEADTMRDAVETEYLTYLATATDRLFTRPLLDDLGEPLTVAFIEAREQMNDLHEHLDRTSDTATEVYAVAVQDCHQAWVAAAEHAEAIGLGTIEPDVAEKLQKARNLLEVALDQSVTTAERNNAIDKVATVLASITGRSKDDVQPKVAAAVGEEQLAIEAATPQLAIAAGTAPAIPITLHAQERQTVEAR